MNINTVYRCPYYGDSIECPNECSFIRHAILADKFYTYDPFFCDRDGVLIDNHKNPICRINIDADIEHSLQNAIDYISKCKVRGEKGDQMAEYVGGKPVVIEKGDKLDMTLQKPIATVNFDAYSVGTYIVEVDANGNWTSRYCFGPTEEEE